MYTTDCFKDGKIKNIKESEFYEFLKLKQSKQISEIMSAKFLSYENDLLKDKKMNPNLSIGSYKSK